MKTNYNERADVLALKLRGFSPTAIAQRLKLSVNEVMSHDRAIKKQMAKGDAETLAQMSPEELEFTKTTITQMLPYMEKSIDNVQASSQTLQALHTDALSVATRIFTMIDVRLADAKLPLKDFKELTELFTKTYEALYNKNGIQIVNMLAASGDGTSEVTTTTLATLDGLREERKKHIDSLNTIEAEVE